MMSSDIPKLFTTNHTVLPGDENHSNPNAANPLPSHLPLSPGLTNQRSVTGSMSCAHSVTKNPFRNGSGASQSGLTAADVWHKSVNQGAVVFDFSPVASPFPKNEPMEATSLQYGVENIRGFKKLSGNQAACYEVLFEPIKASMLRKQATETGIAYKDKTIKATATIEMSAQLTKVKLRHLPLYPSEESLVRVLQQSMGAFGTIRKVPIYKTAIGSGKYHIYSGEDFVMLTPRP